MFTSSFSSLFLAGSSLNAGLLIPALAFKRTEDPGERGLSESVILSENMTCVRQYVK